MTTSVSPVPPASILSALEVMETNSLISRREELVRKVRDLSGKLHGDKLPDAELTELCAIFALLRRRASPTAAKGKTPPTPMSMNDVPADL